LDGDDDEIKGHMRMDEKGIRKQASTLAGGFGSRRPRRRMTGEARSVDPAATSSHPSLFLLPFLPHV